MGKCEFMKTLETALSNLSQSEREDILYDYEEHFRIGAERGKTEEEITKELGDPNSIAKSYNAYAAVENASENPSTKNLAKAIFAAGALGFFNLVLVIGPFLGLLGMLVGFFAASAGLTLAGFCGICGVIAHLIVPNYVHLDINIFAAFFLYIGFLSLGILCFIGMTYLSKAFFRITIKCLKWNLSIIKR